MRKKLSENLKIAMLGHKRVPSREGGVEIVVEEIASRMAEKGHNVTCYNRRGHHVSGREFDTAKLKEYKGIRLKSVPTVDKKGLAAMTSSFFAALSTAFSNYDIIHFHAEGPSAMLWIPKLFKKRCIVTVHGLDHKRGKWQNSFGSKYILFGERVAVKHADEIIVLSEDVKRYFMDTYGRETLLIPNGVSKPEAKEPLIIKEKFALSKDGYILSLGRLVPEKGLEYLIDAFKNVKTNKKLVIAGGSSDSNDYAEELKQKAQDDYRIMFTGFVDGRLLEELYSNAYIYTMPSDLEGMPISLLEAMSYGNCCLTSDIDECLQITADVGFSFEKGSVADLKSKIQMLCDDETLVLKCRKNAAESVLSRYNWDDITDATLGVYFGEKPAEKPQKETVNV